MSQTHDIKDIIIKHKSCLTTITKSISQMHKVNMMHEECRRKLVGSLPWGIPMVVVYL